MKKILLLLPCNKYAEMGDYFKGKAWHVAYRWVTKLGLRKYVTFAAVDSIPYKYGLGDCIVLETEMDRVKGYDSYPEYDPSIVDDLAKCISNGLRRVLSDFDRIIILLNVPLYKAATKKAVDMINSRKLILVNVNDNRPGKFYQKIIETITKIHKDLKNITDGEDPEIIK